MLDYSVNHRDGFAIGDIIEFVDNLGKTKRGMISDIIVNGHLTGGVKAKVPLSDGSTRYPFLNACKKLSE